MAEIIPFKGLRYNLDIVGDISHVTIPPYDIISRNEQEAFYSLNPYNSIRLELPKDPSEDKGSNKYSKAGKTLKSWLEQGVLLEEERDCIYIYQQEFRLRNKKTYTRTGLIALVRLEEFEKGIVLPHENTLSKPKADRLQLMRKSNANFSQVFCLYEDGEQRIPNLIGDYCKRQEPDLVTDKGIVDNTERIWAVQDPQFIEGVQVALKEKQLYIADGHHRYETALAYRDELKAANPNHKGNELYNYVMMTLVDMDDPGLVILPTHRLVNNIDDFDFDSILDRLAHQFDIEEYSVGTLGIGEKAHTIQEILNEKGLHTFVLYAKERESLFSLTLKSMELMEALHPNRHRSYRDLDVSILHSLILERLLGIGERELANQEHLEYTHSIEEGIEGVDNGGQQMAFFMSATTIRQIQDISLANEKMPQKSTYFYPKLLTGLVFNKFR